MSRTIADKVCAPEECTHAYTCAKHAKKKADRVRQLEEKVARVEALVSEVHDEYLSAASEARWLEQGSRERAEWLANAREAAEWRDRIQAALDGATS